MIYLDNAASTPPLAGCFDYLKTNAAALYFNPSAPYPPARHLRKEMESVKVGLAQVLNVHPQTLFFTSGATEANNTVLKSFADTQIICDGAAHASVYQVVKNNPQGRVLDLASDTHTLIGQIDALTKPGDLVSLIHVNNETGEKIDIETIAVGLKQQKHVFIHVDAVQSFLKYPLDLGELPIDFLSASFHKINGLKGAGLLYVKEPKRLKPLIQGGEQEGGMRAGTENTAAILSFQFPLDDWIKKREEHFATVLKLNRFLQFELQQAAMAHKYFAAPTLSPYIVNVSFKNTKSEVLVRALGDKGIWVSNSSACHTSKKSNRKSSSRVLSSKKLSPQYIEGAIRIGLSPQNTEADIHHLVQTIKKLIGELF